MWTEETIQRFDEKLRALVNVQPWQGDLIPAFESEQEAGGVTRTLVRLQMDSCERAGAYLLRPATCQAHKLPAILAIHQHGGNFALGKSEPSGLSADTGFHYGIDMARRGFVVLCPDMLAFEERTPAEWRRREGSAPDGYWYERFEATRLTLWGSSLQAKYLADLSRSLDFLCSLDFVDAGRIGVIGHSLGGQEALWLSWYDNRIAACASSCGFALIKAILRDQINHNMALYVPGLLELGDMDLLAAAVAPRPLFFSAGANDPIFPIDSVRLIAESLREHYAKLGAPDNLRYVEFSGDHGFPDYVREQAYAFLNWKLQGTPRKTA